MTSDPQVREERDPAATRMRSGIAARDQTDSAVKRAITMPESTLAWFGTVFVALAALYLLTTTWQWPYGVDPYTNVLAAHEIGTSGDVYLEDHEHLAVSELQGRVAWVVVARDSATSAYPPGAAALAAPLYAVWAQDESRVDGFVDRDPISLTVPPLAPAAIVTALAAAAGVAMLGLALRQLTDDQTALAATLAAGLATGIWSVAADKLWLHTADVLYLGGALWLSSGAVALGGVAFALAILTRPHTALIAAGTGLGRGLDARSWRPVFIIGIASGLGLVGLMTYNLAVFGQFSISGGIPIGATDFVTDIDSGFFANVLGALFDWKRGLFVYSPFLAMLLPGIPAAWKAAPQWVRGAALGGVAYMVVQLASNRFSGGAGFLGYRYPIELLIATAPLLTLAYTEWVTKRPLAQKLLFVALAVSFVIHGFGQDWCLRFGCRI